MTSGVPESSACAALQRIYEQLVPIEGSQAPAPSSKFKASGPTGTVCPLGRQHSHTMWTVRAWPIEADHLESDQIPHPPPAYCVASDNFLNLAVLSFPHAAVKMGGIIKSVSEDSHQV